MGIRKRILRHRDPADDVHDESGYGWEDREQEPHHPHERGIKVEITRNSAADSGDSLSFAYPHKPVFGLGCRARLVSGRSPAPRAVTEVVLERVAAICAIHTSSFLLASGPPSGPLAVRWLGRFPHAVLKYVTPA